jgi:glycosyltransferase involved in cell wall biosynthesis
MEKTEKNIAVSVLVPVYNTAAYLRKCLDGIVGQTLRNIEIICVNDGSSDNSLAILREYEARDKRITIIDKPNGGLPSARNAALGAARGEYIGFVDSDDCVSKNMYEKMYRAAKKHGAEIAVCGATPFPVPPAPPKWVNDVLSPRYAYYEKFSAKTLFDERGARPFIWRDLIKKDIFDRNGIRLAEDVVVGEDQALQFRIFPKAKGIVFIPDKLYFYRWYRRDSIMNADSYRADTANKVSCHIKMLKNILSEWKRTGEIKKYGMEFIGWSLYFVYYDFAELAYAEKRAAASELVKIWDDAGYYSYRGRFRYDPEEKIKNRLIETDTENNFSRDTNGDREKRCRRDADEKLECIHEIARDESETVAPKISVVLFPTGRASFLCNPDLFCDASGAQIKDGYEILVMSDGNDLRLNERIEALCKKDKYVRAFYKKFNGESDALNRALENCAGDYIIFAEADKKFTQNFSKTVEKAEESGAQLIFGGNVGFDGNKASIGSFALDEILIERKFLLRSGILFEEYGAATRAAFAAAAAAKAEAFAAVPSALSRIAEATDYTRDNKASFIDILRGYISIFNSCYYGKLDKLARETAEEISGGMFLSLVRDNAKKVMSKESSVAARAEYFSALYRLADAENRALPADSSESAVPPFLLVSVMR